MLMKKIVETTQLNEKSGRLKKNNNKPFRHASRGAEEVKTAILDAAEKLLLERNPNQISVREIAQAANVKHPLIFRHFGTKANLILEVNFRSVSEVKTKVEKIENLDGNIFAFFQAVEKNKVRQISLARAMLDGIDPNLLQNHFAVMQRFVELVKKKQKESVTEAKSDPRIVAAAMTATAFGWILYEPFLLASAGLAPENREQIVKSVARMLEAILEQGSNIQNW